MRTHVVAAAVATMIAALPAFASDQAVAPSRGVIREYLATTLYAWDGAGQRRVLAPADRPRLPAPIVEVRNSTLGIRLANGEIVYVRGADVRFEARGPCPQRTPPRRDQFQSPTGGGANGGTEDDCVEATR